MNAKPHRPDPCGLGRIRRATMSSAVVALWAWQLAGCGGDLPGALSAPAREADTITAAHAPAAGDAAKTVADGAATLAGSAPTAVSSPPAAHLEDLTAVQRETLQLAYIGHPAAAQELPRAADRVVFRNRWNRFVALAAVPGADAERERITLAQKLDAGLSTRIERQEIRYGEAVTIKTALLEVLDPSPARRQQALAAWRKNVPAQTSSSGTGRVWTAQERTEEFERLKAVAVAEWEALPAEERDPEELQQYLQQLRESILEPP